MHAMRPLRVARCVLVLRRAPQVRFYTTNPNDTSNDLRSPTNEHAKVLVSGSGITGLTTALALHSKGIHSHVVGNHDQEQSSVFLGFNAMQILHSISPALYDTVKSAGQPITVMEICNVKGKAFGRVDYTAIGKKYIKNMENVTPVGITSSSLHQILTKECNKRKIVIDSKTHLAACIGEPNSTLLCRFTGGRTNGLYEVVVSAEGTHSKIRDDNFKAKEFGLRKRYCGFVWLTAVTERPFMFNSNVLSELWGDEKRFIGIPLENEKVQLYGAYLTEYPLHQVQAGPKNSDEFVKKFPLFGGFAPHVSYALESTNQKCQLQVPQEIKLDKYSNGRLVLVGNAAHAMSPNVHMADTLAMEDAIILANELSKESNVIIEERLDTYSALRVPRVTAVMEESNKINKKGHRRQIGHLLFTPFSMRSGKLNSREKILVQKGFTMPN